MCHEEWKNAASCHWNIIIGKKHLNSGNAKMWKNICLRIDKVQGEIDSSYGMQGSGRGFWSGVCPHLLVVPSPVALQPNTLDMVLSKDQRKSWVCGGRGRYGFWGFLKSGGTSMAWECICGKVLEAVGD